MKLKDITKQINAVHDEQIHNNLLNEAFEDLKDGIPDNILDAVNKCRSINNPNQNVISMFGKSITVSVLPIGEIELLAASGSSLGSWFSQPIRFDGAGFILDIRKVIGSENEVDVSLLPINEDAEKIKETLSPYAESTIDIVISNDGVGLLSATIYIDKMGIAEGSGVLSDLSNHSKVNGKLSVNVSINNR